MPGNEATAVLSQLPRRRIRPRSTPCRSNSAWQQPENLIVSYVQYLANCLTGQFGLTSARVPVMTDILQGLPWTIGLVGVTTVIAFVARDR